MKLLMIEKDFFEENTLRILMLISLLASLAMFWWSYTNGYAVAYGDAASHLNIARRSVDSLTPGIAQMGGVWLPFFHILMLPFIWVDFLWQSGLAGGLLSGLSFIGIVYCVFRTAELLTLNRIAAFFAGLVIIGNPNLLYLQTTPMSESFFIFSVSASIYALVSWYKKESLPSLIIAAVFGFISTLNRYEGWFFILAEFFIVGWIAYKKGGWKQTEGYALAFGFLAGLGPFLWILWNWAIFGNPLFFLTGDFSARSQQVILEQQGLLPTAHHLWLSIKYYAFSIAENNGFLLTGLSLLAIPFIWRETHYRPVIIAFFSITFFEILALYRGITVLYLPYLFPEGALFNVRYGLFMLPLTALVISYGMAHRHALMEGCIALLLILQISFSFSELPITLMEPLQTLTVSKNKQAIGAHFLKKYYQGGKILVSPVENDPFIFHAGLPIEEFVSEGNGHYWREAIDYPERSVTWIVEDESVQYYSLNEQSRVQQSIENNYRLVFAQNGLNIYKRIQER